MKKRILVGSIFVLTLLLLMPSIPAIQQKTIEDKLYSDFEEQVKTLDFEKIKDRVDMVDSPKHPLLRFLVILFSDIQYSRFCIYFILVFLLCMEPAFKWSYRVTKPILFFIGALRMIWFMGTADLWDVFWFNISKLLGWNWDLPLS